MIVIDPKKPETELIDKYKTVFIPKNVTEVTYQDYFDQISLIEPVRFFV